MHVHRLVRRTYLPLDGEGARLYGGRWNSAGVPVVYTASHRSLAALELLAHADPDTIPADLVAVSVEVPDDLVTARVELADLPDDWRDVPDHPACRETGDAWLRAGQTALLAVPSAIVPEETNWLINPRHLGAARIVVTDVRPFAFDPRLVGGI